MKKLLFFFLFFSFAFGVRDYLVKPAKNLSKILYSTVLNYQKKLDSKIYEDEYNIFEYSTHFRIIYGKSYENNETIKSLAESILNIAEEVWDKEINDFGFKNPRNSDTYYIDIYIGNTNAYNKAENKNVTIASYYAGYATSYSDSTPYFVVNPNMSLNLVKVTIAHEFFHTIQYAYGVGIVSNDIWYKNLWFLEATAVMMEDEVFDDVNDYENYLLYYLPYINYSIDLSNGMIEYGKVLFAKFLKNKFGMEFIKRVFEDYQTDETLLERIKKEVVFYNNDFDDVMLDYGTCLANLHTCYKDGESFPDVTAYMLRTSKNVGYYGIVLYSSGSDKYLISSTPTYLQCDFLGNKNVLESINENGLVFVSKKDNLTTDFLSYNIFNGFKLKKGWNLISNIFNENLDFRDFDVNVIWVLRNGKYCAYSNDSSLMAKIKELNYECSNNTLNPGEGAWVYVDSEKNLSIKGYNLVSFNGFTKGWSIRGVSSVLNPLDIDDNVTIWYYDNGEWRYFSDIKEYDYQKLDQIIPTNGYFIYKE